MAMYGSLALLHQSRCSIHLCCILMMVGCVASSSVSVSVSCAVGGDAVLPCRWTTELNGVNVGPISHVQWQTPDDTVFEQKGAQRWQASEFAGRVEVPEGQLERGDCSLTVKDVQFQDVGRYESFVVVDGARMKKRIFIQGVQLSVHDHKSKLSLGSGEDLVLRLHTPRAVRVVVQAANVSEWAELWTKEEGEEPAGGGGRRLEEERGTEERLVLRGVTRADAGTYKVLDSRGLAVSTVLLSVGESQKTRELPHIQAKQTELVENPDHSSTQTTTPTPVMKTDVVEKENKEQTHGNVLLMVAVIGLCATVVLTGLMCLLVTGAKCRKKGKYSNGGGKCKKKGKYTNGGTELRVEDTELQTWSSLSSPACETSASDRDTTVPQMEELHYASLGRQNWRDRPRALGDQQHSHVIYSSVCTRPRDTTTT